MSPSETKTFLGPYCFFSPWGPNSKNFFLCFRNWARSFRKHKKQSEIPLKEYIPIFYVLFLISTLIRDTAKFFALFQARNSWGLGKWENPMVRGILFWKTQVAVGISPEIPALAWEFMPWESVHPIQFQVLYKKNITYKECCEF